MGSLAGTMAIAQRLRCAQVGNLPVPHTYSAGWLSRICHVWVYHLCRKVRRLLRIVLHDQGQNRPTGRLPIHLWLLSILGVMRRRLVVP